MARTELAPRACAAYGAARCRYVPAGGDPADADGEGGGLTTAVEAHGVSALAAALGEGDRVELSDDPVQLELARVEGVVRMRVRWAEGPTYEERLDVAPDGGARLGGLGAVPAALAAADNLADPIAALHDPTRPLALGGEGLVDAPAGGPIAVPAVTPTGLGAASFRVAHGVRGNLVAGAESQTTRRRNWAGA